MKSISVGLLLVSGYGLGHAAILTVSKDSSVCPSAKYTSINAAITASASGDEIDVCPALYAEELVISHPLTIRGLSINGSSRVLIQPSTLDNLSLMPLQSALASANVYQSVISVANTNNVTIDGLVIDASSNSAKDCTVSVSGIHFFNASGAATNNTITGAQLKNPAGCTTLFPGNGFGIEVDSSSGQKGPFVVQLSGNNIHDFNRDGILVQGAGITAEITNNKISGIGPSTGYNQFGVFIAIGAVGQVSHNVISQGNCGAIDFDSCVSVRSEGVVLRAAGDGSIVDSNIITNVQSGLFLNGANRAQITNNFIMNVDALDGIDIQGTASGAFTNSVISGNTIAHVFPISDFASVNYSSCGINEYSGTGVANNIVADNTVIDAYCGVAYVAADQVFPGTYLNTLYATLNEDNYPDVFPPATEPTPPPQGPVTGSTVKHRRRVIEPRDQ